MSTNKSIFSSQQLLAMNTANIFCPERKRQLLKTSQANTYLPCIASIYEKEIVMDQLSIRNSENDQKVRTSDCSPMSFSTKDPVNVGKIFTQRSESRFVFSKKNSISSVETDDCSVNVPSYISSLISKKCLRFAFFREMSIDDEDLLYKDTGIIRRYEEKEDWAQFLISHSGFSRKESLDNFSFLNKFNSA